ncbi:MAG: ribonuclease [Frankiales bacterium]|nr:ribonuclease [Frankiales bacterium]MCW3015620.1 ribonuclease [Solirubrobacterales bacterium]
MPARPPHVTPADAVAGGIAAIRAQERLPEGFPPDVLKEAERAAGAWRPDPGARRIDLPFVTIDPPGSRDLDQAMHLERRGDGHRVHYAIADVGAFVQPGGAIDREAHARAVTVYLPDERVPLHPPVLSEGAASLLPGEDRPALVWTLDLDGTGHVTAAAVEQAVVRSTAQLDYAHVPDELRTLLREIGDRRLALERARGGVSLRLPEQEVAHHPDGWSVAYRVPLGTEDWNAQISLLTGMAAAQIMLKGGIGLLRTQPAPEPKALRRLRTAAAALGAPWPESQSYPEWIRTLDPATPAHAALLHQAAGSGHGAGYTAFDGAPPQDATHFAIAASYAHVTAPLRRMADRYALELCLALCAGTDVPAHVRAALPALPAEMAAGTQRAGRAERAVIDLVEATVLAGRVGERFDAVAIDDDLVQLRDPAVRTRIDGPPLPIGAPITVRLEAVDPVTRTVHFAV